MPDLSALSEFADERSHNLTGELRDSQVVALARVWVPEIRFHEKERFHPVDLPALLTVPSERFQNFTDAEKEEFRVNVHIATEFGGISSPPRKISKPSIARRADTLGGGREPCARLPARCSRRPQRS